MKKKTVPREDNRQTLKAMEQMATDFKGIIRRKKYLGTWYLGTLRKNCDGIVLRKLLILRNRFCLFISDPGIIYVYDSTPSWKHQFPKDY